MTDEVTGAGLPGVTVSVTGKQVRTKTDAEGEYKLDVEPNDRSLLFSLVGYEPLTLSLKGDQSVLKYG